MKINDKILSIPPYISTSWNYIMSVQMKGPFLVITLAGGESINIPNLSSDVVETIFSAHASHMENNQSLTKNELFTRGSEGPDMSFKFGLASMDGFNNPLVHNPEQKNAPEIPKPVLEKIAAIAKIVSPEDLNLLPKAEYGCNCLHCQIVRSIHSPNHENETKESLSLADEPVTEEDLNFQQWDIAQTGDKLFNVSNRLDSQEKYSVYLGHPVGCTCGQNNCEHIIAVLKS